MSERHDGANNIIRKGSKIVIVKHNYGDPAHSLSLPGGSIEPNESPVEAAIREAKEETGLIIKIPKYIGRAVQRFRQADGGGEGLVHLFESNGAYCGEPQLNSNDEIVWAKYLSFQEIIDRREEFGLGYFRLILQYMRCLDGTDSIPFDIRMSDVVKYEPWGLEDRNVVLRV